MSSDTHSVLIDFARAWLWKQRCCLVITDMTHGGRETADAIGWSGRFSILIECKASRSDFLADAKKPFRREPDRGMGVQRYFCAPKGMIRVDELPESWGLLELGASGLRMTRESGRFEAQDGSREEISLLLSAIRRIGRSAPEGINVKFYTQEFYTGDMPEPQFRATMGVDIASDEQPQPQPRPLI
jgi:hypothetical protein